MLDKAIAVGLIISVVFTALAHGAVEPWSISVFELILIALMLLWVAKAVADKRLSVRVPAIALPLAGLLLLGIAQSVATTDDAGRRLSLSLDVEATRGAVVVLFCLLASCLIAANFLVSRERLRAVASFLVIYGLVLAVFAIIQQFTWDGRFYWFRVTRVATGQGGPFVNRNHFAGYMEMLIPIPVALIIARGVRRDLWMFYGFAAAVMGLALVLSLSRGGMLSMAASMLFIVIASSRLPGHRNVTGQAAGRASLLWVRGGAVIAIAIAIAIGVVWVGSESVINRAAETLDQVSATDESNFLGRGWIWTDTWAMFLANPITGVGLGAYQTAFTAYSHGDGSLLVDYAHNDYLQALADGGLIAGALAVWFIVALFRAVWRGLRSTDPLMAGLALGGGAGIFALLVHSLFDFNLQMPSNALLFLVLSAVVSHVGATAGAGDSETGLRRVTAAGRGRVATGA